MTAAVLNRPGWTVGEIGAPGWLTWTREGSAARLSVFGSSEGIGFSATLGPSSRWHRTPDAAADDAERMHSELVAMEAVRGIVARLRETPLANIHERWHDGDCDHCDHCAAGPDLCDRGHSERENPPCTCGLVLVDELIALVSGGGR